MKLRFYLDVFHGSLTSQYGVMAMTVPGKKIPTAKRIAFDVTIPDAMLFDVDGFAPEVSKAEIIE